MQSMRWYWKNALCGHIKEVLLNLMCTHVYMHTHKQLSIRTSMHTCGHPFILVICIINTVLIYYIHVHIHFAIHVEESNMSPFGYQHSCKKFKSI